MLLLEVFFIIILSYISLNVLGKITKYDMILVYFFFSNNNIAEPKSC